MWELLFLAATVAFNLLLGMVVLAKNSSSATHRLFFGLTISLIGYSLANYLSLHPIGLGQLDWIRVDLVWGNLLFLFAYLTFDAFPDARLRPSRWRKLIIGYSVFVAALTLTPAVFSSLATSADGSVQPIPGPGIAFFVAQQLITLGAAFTILIRRLRSARGLRRLQYKYIILSLSLTLGLIILFNLVLVQVFGITELVPFGTFSTILFTAGLGYAIVRQRLFDIRAVVAKSVAYSLLIGTMAVFYGVAIFASTRLIFPDSVNSAAQTATYTALAIVLALTFQPLRRFFEQVTDSIFFRDRYDAQVVLDNVGKILVSEIELGDMLHKSLAQICGDMRIGFGQLIIFNHDRVYHVEHYGKLPDRLIVAPQLQQLGHAIMVADELNPGEKKRIMDDHGIHISAMLRTRDEVVGYLLLGEKLSGEIYTRADIDLIQIIAKELAVAAQNAKAYAEIQAFNVTLQERISHATNRLRVANRHLKELDQAKDEFISMASHQLRTPLTTIKGYLSMMLEGDTGEITPTQRQFTSYAFEGADRMVSLIADLLNVSRLSAGRFMIETRPSDIAAIVSDEVRQLQSHAAAKGLQLTYNAPKRPIPLIALDDNKTRQVIMNFIDNAIYYTKQGTVTVSVAKGRDHVRVTVEDTGIGVPLTSRKKLFSKFYRADNAQTVRPDGTGLGLYLAKRVIEDQGGTIIFESVEGKGSTFGFELPLTAKPTAAPPHKKSAPSP